MGRPSHHPFVKCWQAWQVPAGAKAPGNALDSFPSPGPAGSAGEDNVPAVAPFYEGVVLPSTFATAKALTPMGVSPRRRATADRGIALGTEIQPQNVPPTEMLETLRKNGFHSML